MASDSSSLPDPPADSSKEALFYGGRRSLKGQCWRLVPVIRRFADQAAQIADVPPEVGHLLVARGVRPADSRSFLSPRLADSLPDPSRLRDMDKAAERILAAVQRGERIAVFGDYDVDGATSGSILLEALATLGGDAISYVPDRMTEGYGPNPAAMLVLKKRGVRLVITVDCGTLSFAALERAAAVGLEVIVVDHHHAEARLPVAHAVVNPRRLDEDPAITATVGHLAAVGVVFLLLVALSRLAQRHALPKLNLFACLDRVALGTVCDVVPLTGLNRAFVAQGLKVLAGGYHPGLAALARVARLEEPPSAFHLGFLLGPRINAGGRVGRSHLGTALLTCRDADEADMMARELDGYNDERKRIEEEVLAAALADVVAVEAAGPMPPVLCLRGAGWHAGVVGIVASRLKERFGRPVFVCADDGKEVKGSGRSITGVDLGAAVIEAGAQGLTIKGGGHAMAAGVSLAPDRFDEFAAFLGKRLGSDIARARAGRVLALDLPLALAGATVALVESLDRLAPFGVGNPAPRFLFEDVTLAAATVVGRNHLRLILRQGDGKSVRAMAWRAADQDWGQTLMQGIGQRYHMAGRLTLDRWTGSTRVDMVLEDAMPLF